MCSIRRGNFAVNPRACGLSRRTRSIRTYKRVKKKKKNHVNPRDFFDESAHRLLWCARHGPRGLGKLPAHAGLSVRYHAGPPRLSGLTAYRDYRHSTCTHARTYTGCVTKTRRRDVCFRRNAVAFSPDILYIVRLHCRYIIQSWSKPRQKQFVFGGGGGIGRDCLL